MPAGRCGGCGARLVRIDGTLRCPRCEKITSQTHHHHKYRAAGFITAGRKRLQLFKCGCGSSYSK